MNQEILLDCCLRYHADGSSLLFPQENANIPYSCLVSTSWQVLGIYNLKLAGNYDIMPESVAYPPITASFLIFLGGAHYQISKAILGPT